MAKITHQLEISSTPRKSLVSKVENKIIETTKEVPTEVIKYIEIPIEKIIEKEIIKPVEVIKYVDREVIKEVQKIIEKPIEIIKEVEKIKEVPNFIDRIVFKKQTPEHVKSLLFASLFMNILMFICLFKR